MTADPRYRRPELERSEPVRRWSGVFAGGANGSSAGPNGLETDAVSRAVDTGYRVIDQYLRSGQAQAAASASRPPLQAADPRRFAEDFARSTLDWMGTWFDYVQAMSAFATPGGSGRPRYATQPTPGEVGPFDIGAANPQAPTRDFEPRPVAHAYTPDAAPVAVSIDVDSKLRTEVTVELKPMSAALQLVAHDLRASDATLPRIGAVRVTTHPAENRVSFQIVVPNEQPAAVYSGLIIDEQTQLPRGTLALRVFGSHA